MIEKLVLKSGSGSGQPNLSVDLTPITIFVGPNNSGKSLILKEIENCCHSNIKFPSTKIVEKLIFTSLTEEDIQTDLDNLKLSPDAGQFDDQGHIKIGKITPGNNNYANYSIKLDVFLEEAANPNINKWTYYGRYFSLFLLRLDGSNRLDLVKRQKAGDLKANPKNLFQLLFTDDCLRKKVRNILYHAFKKYFIIDPTDMGFLKIAFSERPPEDDREEKGWENRSVDFHKSALSISDASDGLKAFTGIIISIIGGEPRIVSIDEPEAFLHPSLSNKLGIEVGKSIRELNKRLFVSTHSSDFLMGCIQSNTSINIIRLTYSNGIATSRVLPQNKLSKLMRNPLLRSTGVLNGLFYESVVVTESDSDRAFYQEINERNLAYRNEIGINNCLFLNAQNKQTVWDIVKPLREMGIPAAGIVDIDAIKDGGSVWTKLLRGGFIPNLNHEGLHNQRQKLLKKFQETGKNMKRDGGNILLESEDRQAFSDFLDHLADYGIFILPGGELESWLKNLNVTGHGPSWLIEIFKKMGEDPNNSDYVKPSINDVWDFMGKVHEWLSNQDRKGIPK